VIPLPGPLRLTPTFPFVGRSRERAVLTTLMPRAVGEGQRVALIGGEPGSGKSRLVREVAHVMAAEDVLVLYGACDAVVHTPYRPFVEALDHLVRTSDDEALRQDLGTGGGELTRLLPDLPLRVGSLPRPVSADQDTERHRLHTAVTDVLMSACERQPMLLVIEDGHWADTATLLLLRHLAKAAGGARLLIVATFRDTEADVPAELSDALADLRRTDGITRLHLEGLSPAEVADFLRQASGGEAGTELSVLAGTISELTGGNAFLMTELWRELLDTGTLELVGGEARLTRPLEALGSPESVREVVSQRLSRLEASTAGLLEVAAVIGPEFEVDVLRHASGLDDAELFAALDQAAGSAMIAEVPPRGIAYRFTHELVRRALYDRLAPIRRAELHLRVGEALELVYGLAPARVLPGLAYHFAAAAPVGGRRKAIEYNVLAARAAMTSLAFDEASARLRTALDLGIERDTDRANVLLAFGAALFRAGRFLDTLDAYRAAADIGRELEDAELFAHAAVGFENTCWRPGAIDQGALELLEEASAMLDAGDSELRVMLLSGLGRALAFLGNHERATVVQRNAIAMARRLSDRPGLAHVLTRAYWTKGANTLDEILDMVTEARDIASELGDIEMQAEASEWRLAALIALGELTTARRELAQVLELAHRMRQPFVIHVAEHYASAIALADGRLRDAEEAAERSREWSQLLTGRDASGVYGVQMFGLRREQGRLAELAPVLRVLAAADKSGGSWTPGLVALLAELGMHDELRRELAQLRARGLDHLRQTLWLASLTYLTDAVAVAGDEVFAELLYPELTPHAGQNVMIGHGVASYGSADRYLGMLAAALGEWEQAEGHFEAALEQNRQMGAATWLAHSSYEYARMLLARRGAGDEERAASLLGEARELAESIGMPTLLGRIGSLKTPVASGPRLPDGLSARELEILQLVARGLSNRDIGATLYISEHTAANHIRSILRKTGCANRTEAATYAHSHGLVEA